MALFPKRDKSATLYIPPPQKKTNVPWKLETVKRLVISPVELVIVDPTKTMVFLERPLKLSKAPSCDPWERLLWPCFTATNLSVAPLVNIAHHPIDSIEDALILRTFLQPFSLCCLWRFCTKSSSSCGSCQSNSSS